MSSETVELKIKIPALQESLNPEELEVEYCDAHVVTGDKAMGEWQFYYSEGYHRWMKMEDSIRHGGGQLKYYLARLVPRQKAWEDIPIENGKFRVGGLCHVTVSKYRVGVPLPIPDQTRYVVGYGYPDGTISDDPIQYRRYDTPHAPWGKYDSIKITHFRRATFVRVVDLSKLQEVKE